MTSRHAPAPPSSSSSPPQRAATAEASASNRAAPLPRKAFSLELSCAQRARLADDPAEQRRLLDKDCAADMDPGRLVELKPADQTAPMAVGQFRLSRGTCAKLALFGTPTRFRLTVRRTRPTDFSLYDETNDAVVVVGPWCTATDANYELTVRATQPLPRSVSVVLWENRGSKAAPSPSSP